MTVERAALSDLKRISEIYYRSRIFMALSGNSSQWAGGYPDDNLIKKDIRGGNLYKVTKKGDIEAVFAFAEGPDPTYTVIDGKWLSENPYHTLHRVASSGRISGISHIIFSWCKANSLSVRIDTHESNKVMQNALAKNGFKYCGIIITDNGTPRLAYQWEK